MKKSKISILLLLVVMILAISAVSAADTNDTSDSVVQAVDEAPVEEVASADVDAVAATDNTDVLADPGDGNNFTSLQTLIDNYDPTQGYIPISKDYTRVESDKTILIDKTVNLVSTSNSKIDANNLGGIFNVTAGGKLLLVGLTLVNGNAPNGGAIYNEGKVVITTSTFDKNTATNNGGAIYNKGEFDISASTFTGNTATYRGGAIYNEGTLSVDDGTFDSNDNTYRSANNDNGGAAIYNLDGTITVSNSRFTNNLKNLVLRGANGPNTGDVINAIITSSGVTNIYNSIFENNSGCYGGAVCVLPVKSTSTPSLTMDNCNFINNIAYDGGAMYIGWGNVAYTISNCIFEDNLATGYGTTGYTAAGGAIDIVWNPTAGSIVNCTFKRNNAKDGASPGGSAVAICGASSTIDGCVFEDNYASSNGGAVSIKKHKDKNVLPDVDITNCNFTNNNASGNGGAVYLDGNSTVDISGCKFEGNTANDTANAVYNEGTLTLSQNTVVGDKAEIVSKGEVVSQVNIDILNNATVTTNDGKYLVNATVTDGDGNLIADIAGIKFVVDGADVEAIYNASTKVYEGLLVLPGPGVYTVNATYIDDDKLDIQTATIRNYKGTFMDLSSQIATAGDELNLTYDFKYIPELDGNSYLNGIEINANPEITINGNGHIIDGANSAEIFYIMGGMVTLNNITFVNGNATAGGAIYIGATATNINDCTFENNTATSKGGAIYIEDSKNVAISDSTFKGNKAQGNPDAIYSNGFLTLLNNNINTEYAEITVTQYIPTQCYATVFDGVSPVYVDDAHVNLTARVHDDSYNLIYATQDVFKFNITDSNGASHTVDAISGYETYTATYDLPAKGYYNVTFQYHDYIQANTVTVAYIDGTFTDLQRLVDAAEGELNLTFDFAYDPAVDGANFIGGVSINKNLTINGNGVTINGNDAARIFNVASKNTLTINNATLTNGNASQGGAINVEYMGSLTANYVNFTNNKVLATKYAYGGAINTKASCTLNINNCIFDNNEANLNAGTSSQGGAIATQNKNNVTIISSTFTNNKASRSGAAVYIGSANNLTVYDSRFENNSGNNVYTDGGAIYVSGSCVVSVGGNSEFINNMAKNGAAIYVTTNGKEIEIKDSVFKSNNATNQGGAIRVVGGSKCNVSVTGSTFEDNTNNNTPNSIYLASGNLELSGNTIVGDASEITVAKNAQAKIISTVIAIALNNDTYDKLGVCDLNATLTDEDGHKVYDENLRFTINGVTNTTKPDYDEATGLYTLNNYQLGFEPEYIIGLTSTRDLNPQTGIIKNLAYGTFTDLQAKIAAAGNELNLTYDFTYNVEIDGANFPGIVINKDIIINGNGAVIDANGSSMSIFTIATGTTVTLSNMTITGVNGATSGITVGAVWNDGILTVDNCTFKDNKLNSNDVSFGAAICNDDYGSLTVVNSKFINNTVPTDYQHSQGGAIYSCAPTGLSITDSYFEANSARFGGAIWIINLNQATPAVENCTFYNNFGYQGGAINAAASEYVNITNCTFDSNYVEGEPGVPTTGACGGAIASANTAGSPVTLEVSDSIFKGNYYSGSAKSAGSAINLGDNANGIIDNCTFEDNYGSQSVVQVGITGKPATFTLKNSTFSGNDANKTIVGIISDVTATVSGNDFSGETADTVISNNGTLSLDNNVISTTSAKIVNYGTIDSIVNITILNAQTLNATYGENVTLTATYTDGVNKIYDPNFKFTVDGVAEPINATYKDGVYTGYYVADIVGEKVVNTTLNVDKVYTAILNIQPANTVITISANDTIMRKQNETITINLVDEFGNLLNVTLDVHIRNSTDSQVFSELITTVNGTYTFEFYGSAVDTYTILVLLNDNVNYNFNYQTKTFEVIELDINSTFTELQKLINDTVAGETLVLPHDITYDSWVDDDFDYSEGIIIDKNITIDGNGTTIDANKSHRIFKIADGITVTIKNLTLLNGKIATQGAAIFTEAAYLELVDCAFVGNDPAQGGALFIKSGLVLTIDGLFENNTASEAGGAIYVANGANLTVNGATFRNNTAEYGGAIYVNSTDKLSVLIVDNANFIENKATLSGGAIIIYDGYKVTYAIANSLFENNSAVHSAHIDPANQLTVDGGAIYVGTNSTGYIFNSTFRNNKAYDDYWSNGGAVKIGLGATIAIKDSTFEENEAGYAGGAIDIQSWTDQDNDVTIDNCTFTANTASAAGGAIAIVQYGGKTDLTIKDSRFTANTASANYQAIYIGADNNVEIINSNFTNNGADDEFAINNLGNLALSGNNISNIIYNRGTIITNVTARILENDTYDITVNTYELTATLKDGSGNDIFDPNFKFKVNDDEFAADYNATTKVYNYTYTLTGERFYTVSVNTTLTYNNLIAETSILRNITGTFTDLDNKIKEAIKAGVTLDLPYDFTYTEAIDGAEYVNGIVINETVIINGNGVTIDGNNTARIFQLNAHNIAIDNTTFINGYANTSSTNSADWGGAIYSNGAYENHTISNSRFYNNTAYNGGAIYWAGDNGLLVNSEFKDNEAIASGGAVFLIGWYCNITGSTFEDNAAGEQGGAVAWRSSRAGEIEDSTFINNTAGQTGGAVTWLRANGKIIDSNFTENKAPNAGAVYWAGSNGTITGGKFSKNNATGNLGGAIFSEGTGLTISSTFEENTAVNGGAIALYADADVNASEFTSNSAKQAGGAIFINKDSASVSVSESDFTGNDAIAGKSIYLNTGKLELSENTIAGTETEIENNEGSIISKINVVVLEGQNWTTNKYTVKLNATVKDDKGNFIKDAHFNFTIDGNSSIKAIYNDVDQIYEATHTLSAPGVYLVNVTYITDNELSVETYNITCIFGTFTDLDNQIKAANGELNLTYDFTYNAELDGANFPGIEINKDIIINGNGAVIDANGSSMNILTIASGYTVTLANTTVTGVNMATNKKYGAVVNHGDLTIDNCTFKDNNINMAKSSNGGAAVFNDGSSLIITGSKFINNTAPWGGSTGAVSSWVNSYVLIEDSYFERNVARFGAGIEIEELDQKEVAIKNCTFYNNTGYVGVAIDANANTKYLNITNCTFDSNNFHGPQGAVTTGAMGAGICAGTVRNVPVTVEVSDSVFKNNYGDNQPGSTGAAIRLSDCASGIITNCTFENNYGTPDAAISVGTLDNDTATVTIKDSTFIGNNATNGISVSLDYGISASIEGCDFSADTNDIAIYNSGDLTLDNNVISTTSAKIVSRGTIESQINATFLGDAENNTIAASLGEVVYPYATLTDDRGNAIFDADFKITIDGVEYETSYDESTLLYNTTYTIKHAGDNIVSTNYTNATIKVEGKYDVPKANVTNFTVTVENITKGNPANVVITLTGVNGTPLSGNVTVYLNNTKYYPVKVINGTGILTVEDLALGSYPVFATFEDTNYNEAINSTVFYVRTGTTLTVDPVDPVDYGTPITFTIHLVENGSDVPISGLVYVGHYAAEDMIVVKAGEATYTVPSDVFAAPNNGVHEFVFTFEGDNYYNASEARVNVTVNVKNLTEDDINVTFEGSAPDDVNVTVSGPDGTYNITVEGQTYQVDVINGTGSTLIPVSGVGVKNATIAIDEDNYNLTPFTVEFTYSPLKGTYSDLQYLIDTSNGTLVLPYDFAYDPAYDADKFPNGVVISADMNITGDGSVISGENAYRIFFVTNGATLTLSDAALTGGNAEIGGAIYVDSGAALDVSDALFYDNTATLRGGAIYSEGTVTVNRTVFYSNDITNRSGSNRDFHGGAAIFNLDGTLTVDNSEFVNNIKNYVINTLDQKGDNICGAITTSGTATIMNSEFRNNSASYGSAIEMAPLSNDDNKANSLTVDNCEFYDNTAMDGAIQAWDPGHVSEFTVLNSYFENNVAVGADIINGNKYTSSAGAINTNGLNKGTIKNTTFIGNKVIEPSISPVGGAIKTTDTNIDIEDCTFVNNYAAASGGAVYLNGNATVSNCNFISNVAVSNGGAIFAYLPKGTLNINDCNFTDNEAGNGGAAVYAHTGDVNIDGAIFTGNDADKGAAIYVKPTAAVAVEVSKFDSNTANVGEAIYVENASSLSVETSIFENVIATINVNDSYIFGDLITITGIFDWGVNNATIEMTYKINGVEQTVNATEGAYTITIDNQPDVGTYTIVISTFTDAEGNTYIVDPDQATFTVEKATPEIAIEVDPVTYGQYPEITINLTGIYGVGIPDATLIVFITDDDMNRYEYITGTDENGTAFMAPILVLAPGTYNVTAFFEGNDNYAAVNKTESFNVTQAEITELISENDDNVTIGEGVDITVTNITGLVEGDLIEVNLTVTDATTGDDVFTEKYNITVGNVISVPALPAGSYSYAVTFTGDDKYTIGAATEISAVGSFEVEKLNVTGDVSITGSEITYGENGTITVDFIEFLGAKDASGNVTVTLINVTGEFTADVVDGIAIVEIPGLAGNATYAVQSVVYSGDDKYGGFTVEDSNIVIEVAQAESSVTMVLVFGEGTYPGNLTAIFMVQNATEVHIQVLKGVTLVYNNTLTGDEGRMVLNGFNLTGLSVGSYTVIVSNNATGNYKFAMGYATFNVEKAAPEISASAGNVFIGADNIVTVTVSPNAVGNVTIIVNGKEYIAEIEGTTATATVEAEDIIEGVNSVYVMFDGDGNYTMNYNSTTFMAYSNVVTNDTFFEYFDENGILLDNVTFDELIFEGEFSGLGITHIIVGNIDITGQDATLTNIGFVANGNVTLSDMTLIADTSLGALIYVSDDNVIITGMDISYTVGDEDAIAIDVTDRNNVIISGNSITFESQVAVDDPLKSAMAINIEESTNVIIEGNDINTTLNAVDAYYGDGGLGDRYGMMGVGNINPVRILGSSDITFNSNNVDSKLSDIKGYWSTLQSVIVVASKDLEFDGNNFTMIDDVSALGTTICLYALTFGMTDNVILTDNNFFISTEGGATASGAPYALQIVSSNMTIVGNNITSISNGPNLGIYAVSDYKTHADFELYIAFNNINVTGKATSTTTNYDLLSGIEIGAGDIEIENNIINVYNKAGYVDGAYVYGISFAQSGSAPAFIITDNVIIVPDANYAIGIYNTDDVIATGNYLIANTTYGDDSVYVNGTSAFVETNFPARLNLTVTANDTTVGTPAVIEIRANELFSGEVTVTIGTDEYIVELTDGVGNLTVDLPAKSEYVVVVEYLGDTYFKADETNTTFTVNRLDTQIIINTTDIVVDENVGVTIVVPGATGNVTVTIDGVEQELPLVNGVAITSIDKITAGDHSITVAYDGDDYYAPGEETYNFTVNTTDDYELIAELEEATIDVGDTAYVIVTLPGDAKDDIIIKVNGSKYTQAPADGTVSIPLYDVLPSGEYTITVTYSDAKYSEKSVNLTLTVNKIDAGLAIDVDDITVGESALIRITADSLFNGNVSVTVNGKTESVELINGNGSLTVEGLPADDYEVTVSSAENDLFTESSANATFTVFKEETVIDITTGEIVIDEDLSVNITVPTDNVTVTFDGTPCAVDYKDGVANVTISKDDMTAGEHTLEVVYAGDATHENATESITFTVNKEEDYEFTAELLDAYVDVGETAYVVVTLPDDADEYIFVFVDGELANFGAANSTVVIPIEDILTGGEHVITVAYADEKYSEKYANLNLTVDKISPEFIVSVENITVVEDAEIVISADHLFIAEVAVTVNGNPYNVTIVEGYGKLVLPAILTADTYNVTVSFQGDDYFLADEANATFTVSRLAAEMNITTTVLVVDENVTVTITVPGATGDVIVSSDLYEGTLQLNNSVATFTIANIPAGDHFITANYTGDNIYDPVVGNHNFTVEKAENYTFDVNLSIDEIDIGENVTVNVTLPEDANGNLTVSVDGEVVDVVKAENGTASVTIPADKFTAGKNNTISVTYSDDKYGETTVSKDVQVNKLPVNLTATADNIELGQNATIVVNLPSDIDGVVSVVVNGNVYVPVDGKVVLENLTEGTYTADVYFFNDSRYEDNNTAVTFNVTKVVIPADQAFNFTNPENGTQVISVNLPEDATGFLLLDINGTQTHVPLVNGSANVTVPKLAEGTYNATVTYTGDDKYAPISTTKELNVTSNVPDSAFNIPDTAKSDVPTTYSINLPSDATGYLEVDVDGKKYSAPLTKGSASVSVPALSAGKHNVTVKYSGDDNYSPVTKSSTLSVSNPVFKLSKNKNVKAVYSAKATYKVLVTRDGKAVGKGKKVTFKFNGKKYTVKTDSKGYATLKLKTKVKVKKYKITATYKGVTVKNTVKITHVIKAKKAKIKKSKKVNKIKVKTKKVNKKYLKGKKLTLKLKGKKVKAKINKKGVATFKLKKKVTKKLKKGKKYKYTVTYGKDKVTKKVKVKK